VVVSILRDSSVLMSACSCEGERSVSVEFKGWLERDRERTNNLVISCARLKYSS
jgi:hypothetical protein